MSLHAQLAPEAEAALLQQQRQSTITSIIISILSCILILLALLYWWLEPVISRDVDIVTYVGDKRTETRTEKPTFQRPVKHKPTRPSIANSKVIHAITRAKIALPVININVPNPSTEYGAGEDLGDDHGNDIGNDSPYGGIPTDLVKRCSPEDRMNRLSNNGGNAQCEQAVMKSLRWLKKTQNTDGSWTGSNQGAMTGFALLAFLGHCETPNSEEFGDAVTSAIVYLIGLGMKNDGRLATSPVGSHHWVYEHGIATYALAEAYTFCNSMGINLPNLAKVTKTAGDMIIQGQTDAGGWLYGYKSGNGGDNSVGFWQIQALKACKHTKLWDDKHFKTVSRKALAWLSEAQGPNGAIGYRGNPDRSPGLTGGGVLAYQMWGKSHAKEVRMGAKYIRNHTQFKWDDESSDLYYHYYNAQAMFIRGGEDWRFYNNLFRDELLQHQKADGTWQNKNKHSGNLHMSTCLATFMLEVYYRFLPATSSAGR
ncbi:MAG: terpene cyclase/mutase family protein [Verrucomicrobiae bacterium]|nr:terpene cyclase/mutase family protein [Verrucomicrobiae bacterium]NNJ86342.1 terpene cyclase/mutase family protein [Akkermansiaceae bacterium]